LGILAFYATVEVEVLTESPSLPLPLFQLDEGVAAVAGHWDAVSLTVVFALAYAAAGEARVDSKSPESVAFYYLYSLLSTPLQCNSGHF
jgi:hypothetical protein